MIVLPVKPFLHAKHWRSVRNSRRLEIHFVVVERLHDRADALNIFCQSFQFTLFLIEFCRLVVKFGLVLRQLTLNVRPL